MDFEYRRDPEEEDDSPLAPIVDIVLRHNNRNFHCRAIIDSGSSFSTITEAARQALGPRKSGDRPNVFGATDTKEQACEMFRIDAMYFAGVEYPNFTLTLVNPVTVVALIGRDILNKHRALLDGPGEELTID